MTIRGNIMKSKSKVVIGLVEKITILGNRKRKTLLAKIDTGATRSSIDLNLAKELKLGPVLRSKLIKSAHGSKLRPIVEVEVMITKKKMKTEFTLADRSHMKYGVLIGLDVLKNGFIIDPMKK